MNPLYRLSLCVYRLACGTLLAKFRGDDPGLSITRWAKAMNQKSLDIGHGGRGGGRKVETHLRCNETIALFAVSNSLIRVRTVLYEP